MNLADTAYDLFADNLARASDRTAVIDDGAATTYLQLQRRVAIWAAALAERGVTRGDRVAIHLRKGVDEIVAQLAAWRLGAVVVNVGRQCTPAQTEYVLRDCSVTALVTDAARARQLVAIELTPALTTILVIGEPLDDVRAVAATHLECASAIDAPTVRVIDRDLAAIIYTSGSSGPPKGVMLSHQNLVLGARSVARYLDVRPDDRLLSILPLCFDYGLNQLLTTWLVGATLVLQRVPMPAEIVATIARERVTGVAAVPPTWVQLVRYLDEVPTPLPSLRYVTNSGGKIPTAVLERMPAVLPNVAIVSMYGFTEAFRSTYLPPDRFRAKMGSIGRAIPNAETFVIDPQIGVCGPGQTGELVHRGSLVSLGYWGRPAATAEKIKPCPELSHIIGDEPVAYSGDLVRIDDDGDYWFVGRRDGMLKSSGFRISPTEIEDIVYASDMIAEAVAFGVDDEQLGQAVHVAVAPAPGVVLDLVALMRHAKVHMPHYMVPRVFHPWDGAMPRTPSGKLDRPRIEAACRTRSSGDEKGC